MPVKTKIAQAILDAISDRLEGKNKLDSTVNLSMDDSKDRPKERLSVNKLEGQGGYMTLLSEGSVLYSDGTIRLYIAKGTLKKWYDSLDSSFEGYVTTGHISLDAFPVRDGYFKKADLKIVTDSEGRSDLLVKPHVNTELSNIKDLIIQDEPFAISSEFFWLEKELTDDDLEDYSKLVAHNLMHGGDYYVPVADTVDILGFSFVGSPGNAKSGGYEPSILLRNEEEHLKNKDILAKVLEKLSTELGEEVTEEVTTETEVTEEDTQEVEDTASNDVKETLEKATQRIEELEKEKAEKEAEIKNLEEKLSEYLKSETKVNEQLVKLEKLLSKTNPSVETKLEVGKEEETNIFGRKRFGGQ